MTNLGGGKKEYLSQTFSGLSLSNDEVCAKEFEACTFIECDFNEATFSKCKFIDCSFIKCNLSVLKVNLSRFTGVAFEECKVIGIDWSRASWSGLVLPAPLSFKNCVLNYSSFMGLSLKGLVIDDCMAHDVDFRDGNFSEADFTGTDFSNSQFNQTSLIGADFSEATNYDINIHNNQIEKAKFCRYEAVRLLDCLGVELVD